MDGDASRSLSSSEVSCTSSPPASGNKTSPTRRLRKKVSVTIPKPFNLSLPSRGEERMKFNVVQRHRQAEQEKLWRERWEQREVEEEEARMEERRRGGFKANPVRVFKSLAIQPSNRPLTQPELPHLRTSMLGEMRRRDSGAGEGVREGRRVRGRRRGSGGTVGHGRCSRDDPLSSPTFTDGSQGTMVESQETGRGTLEHSEEEEEGREEEEGMEGREAGRGLVTTSLSWKISTMIDISDSYTPSLLCDVVVVLAYYMVFYYTVYLVCS